MNDFKTENWMDSLITNPKQNSTMRKSIQKNRKLIKQMTQILLIVAQGKQNECKLKQIYLNPYMKQQQPLKRGSSMILLFNLYERVESK